MRFRHWLVLMVLAIGAYAALASTYYVDATIGNDSYTGTAPTVGGKEGNVTIGPRQSIKWGLTYLETNNVTRYKPGDTLVIAPGVYSVGPMDVQANNVTIRGATGNPEDVIITSNIGCGKTGCTFSSFTVSNVTISVAGNACGLCLSAANSGSLVTNCVFTDCKKTVDLAAGAAVFVNGGGTVIDHCVFRRCQASSGGAVKAQNMSGEGNYLTFRSCTFTSNAAYRVASGDWRGYGAAIDCDDPADSYHNGLILEDCVFEGNFASAYGGVLGDSRIARADRCRFIGNGVEEAGGFGGINRKSSGGGFVNRWNSCVFISNSVPGAASIQAFDTKYDNGGVIFSNCQFVANSAYGLSGISGNYNLNFGNTHVHQFYDCQFRSNRMTGSVGFSGSTSMPTGRISFFGNANGVVSGCTFEDNETGGSCSCLAIPLYSNTCYPSRILVERSRFIGNRCLAADTTYYSYGGVFFCGDVRVPEITFRQCLIVSNVNAHCGGTISFTASSPRTARASTNIIENCTIADNRAAGGTVYGIYYYGDQDDSTDAAIRNNIIVGNASVSDATDVRDIYLNGRSGYWYDFAGNNIFNNVFEVFCAGAGKQVTDGYNNNTVGRDPRFVNRTSGDYRIYKSSPARGLALVRDWMTGTKDLKGGRGVLDEQGQADSGCYAYVFGLMLLFR